MRIFGGLTRSDVLIPLGAFAVGLTLWPMGIYTVWSDVEVAAWLRLFPLALGCGALLFRRIRPGLALTAGTIAAAADVTLGPGLTTFAIYPDALYTMMVYGHRAVQKWLLAVVITLSAILGVTALALSGSLRGAILTAAVAVAVIVSPVLTGFSVRQYRERAQAERARAEQMARMAELDRRNAVVAERTRMARELHDVIANHLSAVALHSSAALKLRDMSDESVREALTVIRENSVRGLTEMRQMIGLLRHADEPAVPESIPRIDEVGELLERTRNAGLPAKLRLTGEAAGLPAAVELTAYRIVQEALTNALKHGGRDEAVVTIEFNDDRVAVTIENSLASGATCDGVPGSGAGLLGMKERVSLLGGTLTAGPQDRRWHVRAELPVNGHVS